MAKKKYSRPSRGEVYGYTDDRMTAQEWEDFVQHQCRQIKRSIRKHLKREDHDPLVFYDMTEPFEKRRKKAILRTLPELYDRFDRKEYPPSSIGWLWTDLNFCANTYAKQDHDHHLLYAAAIWILDQIRESDKDGELLDQLYALLPEDRFDLDTVSAPDAWCAAYDEDLIKSVMYVLQSRNDYEYAGDIYLRSFTSEALATGKTDPEDYDRTCYDQMIRLIPQDAIDEACEHFRDLFWKWVELFYKPLVPSMLRTKELRNSINSNQVRYNKIVDQICSELDTLEKQERIKPSPVIVPFNKSFQPTPSLSAAPDQNSLNAFLGQHNASTMLGLAIGGNGIPEMYAQLEKLEDRVNEELDEINELVKHSHTYIFRMTFDGHVTSEHQSVLADIRYFEQMAPLGISDPYELCFALLYLAESNDELPWLYGAGCGLMSEVIAALPWSAERDPEQTESSRSEAEDTEVTLTEGVTIPDCYTLDYQSDDECDGVPRNLAQLVYEVTGCVLPRDMHGYDSAVKKLSSCGIHGKEAASLLVLMNALGSARNRLEADNLMSDFEDEFFDEDEDEEENSSAEEILREEEDIAALKRENKRLRSIYADIIREQKKLRQEFSDFQNAAALERRELADLRDYVFNQENDAETENAAEEFDTEKWPYTVQRNTLVFGGHATWVKGIKGILDGNIRFIDKGLVFDTSIIRSAEIIWIQPNALSHKMYWRIMDTARTLGKPVRYFSFASWAKCAEQVVAADI